jgi:hypothetical protein
MNIPVELKTEILQILNKSDLGLESSHAINTLDWVFKIKPNASLALQIAALAHDIERGVPPRYKSEDFNDHNEYKKAHSDRGAKILEEILQRHNMNQTIIKEATDIVKLHEVGGTEDAYVLMDADSVSFFDNTLEFYFKYKGLEGTLKQIDYKFKRCSPRAQKYIGELNSYKSFKQKLKSTHQL